MLFRDTVPLILSFHWWDACFWMLGFILLTRKSDGHHETDSDKKSWLKLVGHTTDLLPPTRPLPSLKNNPRASLWPCDVPATQPMSSSCCITIELILGPGYWGKEVLFGGRGRFITQPTIDDGIFFGSISIDKYGCKGMKDVLIAKTMLLTRRKKTKQSHGRSLLFCLYNSYYLSSNVQGASNKWCSFFVN